MRDVLVFTPYGPRLEPETVKAIGKLEWDGPLAILFQRDNPFGPEVVDEREREVRNNHHQCVRAREIFLGGHYEAMLVIESDIIPPPDTLRRLAALECDAAYGCYLFRRGTPVVNVFKRYRPWPEYCNVGSSLMVEGEWDQAVQRGVVECSGGGLGCVLIRRNVLEQVPFRIDWPEVKVHTDTHFGEDVHKKGFRMLADTGVRCGHKTPEGQILWIPG